ncbi:Response regulator receiver domain-containing protein [Methanolobus vulcani]|jgi:CheY-like chemotaxis protein|uniref:Response regulator receiver domain-containing protein n=1 Tax=Methanolobus vulcani TaxID=38026 RepID=A0A7Z7AZ62_9EURY|nr:response regulator [Methanolobus vulcani]MDK2946974.1 two-component system, cell cycle response regulator DivK [Methanolobus sp.]SDF79077.1 Response regulator receiver domain-containing protein [Methanolobus vulcani]
MCNILVIEDNPVNMELTVDLLESYGYDVTPAEDGFIALDKVKEKEFDLILLDIQLPKMDGLEVLSRLKEDQTTKDIPVIALTAHSMRGDDERFIAAGCIDYISKPIDIHSFKEKIQYHLEASN